ncbi:M23 family metallopeptidase [Micromonospora sp. DR5-3]|uniref:M23 family metallopeptidase n=1 Tax=unclassified Micromonospora TaxID=2617518 RepID=UPI0011D38353|nr:MULTISPECIES: M23 family metallopeptidase [unclassified Micromonospora]MCW3814274.1 M23 family metallopeptidase [Micromonospora sp. DR5-3]TYC20500.1 M23 family metallopeptidase [Micromonospora sp. MP36]
MRLRHLLRAVSALVIGIAGTLLIANPAQAAPAFQLPFPCGQTWQGNSSNSSAHVSWEIDFNRGSTASADLGDTVVAAAAGTVEVSAHQGETNGYGNLIVINHGGGYYTYYAHLDKRAVLAGESVLRGQAIGAVGNTSRSGNNISPHLHYEVRYPDRSQSHIIKAVFNGATFGYPDASVTSRNCATSYDPAAVCGGGFEVTDSKPLGSAGTTNLLWNGSTSQNCVVTLKMANVGTATATSAFLEPEGSTRSTDSGNYSYYAGPVIRTAPGCVKWGGSTGGASYTSPFEHCG